MEFKKFKENVNNLKFFEIVPGVRVVFYDGLDERVKAYTCGRVAIRINSLEGSMSAHTTFTVMNSIITPLTIQAFNTEGLRALLIDKINEHLLEGSHVESLHWDFDKMMSPAFCNALD